MAVQRTLIFSKETLVQECRLTIFGGATIGTLFSAIGRPDTHSTVQETRFQTTALPRSFPPQITTTISLATCFAGRVMRETRIPVIWFGILGTTIEGRI